MSEVLSSAAISVFLSGLLVWCLRTWISTRLKASIQHEYDQKLSLLNAELKYNYEAKVEILKSEFQRESEKLRFATSTFGEAQRAVHQRKLDALEKLWQGVLAINSGCPTVLKMLDIVTVDELPQVVKKDTFLTLMKGVELKAMQSVLEKLTGDYEVVRPYVGEVLWTQFQVYQTVVMRSSVLASQWETDPKKLDWGSDQMNQALITAAVGTKAFEEFSNKSFGRLSWLEQKITGLILKGIEQVISGRTFGEEALRQAEQLETLIQKAKTPPKNPIG